MAKETKFTALNRYRRPFNYELAGKHFHFVLDNGEEYSMFFMDGENLQLAEKKDGIFHWHRYECLKADETTYWVGIDVFEDKPIEISSRVDQMPGAVVPNWVMNWIIDTENRLVTRVKVRFGKIPECPDALSYVISFGAIKVPGLDLPEERHAFTDRLVGKKITWCYSPYFEVTHIYYEKDHYRLPKRRGETEREKKDAEIARMRGPEIAEELYPFAEEPCFQIAIKEKLTLFAFSEINQNKASRAGNGGLMVLINTERLIDVGRSLSVLFGSNAICATGRLVEEPDPVESLPSPYTYDRDEFIEID